MHIQDEESCRGVLPHRGKDLSTWGSQKQSTAEAILGEGLQKTSRIEYLCIFILSCTEFIYSSCV